MTYGILGSAALGHNTFDSSHISFGVVTAAVDYGRWFAEATIDSLGCVAAQTR
jgi:hypothetical protein